MSTVRIPVQVRTARKERACSDYLCRTPILPGDQYEDYRQPPGSYEWGDYDHWAVHQVHAPSRPVDGPTGCDIAAAYAEHAAREAARARQIAGAA